MNLIEAYMTVAAYEHKDDETVIKLRSQIEEINRQISDYLRQYIPEELRK